MARVGLRWLFVLLLAGGVLYPAALPTAAAPAAACRTFPQTGKTVCDPFLSYWLAHGGLAQQGLPLTGEFVEISPVDGKPYTVQYFERARFEKHPENRPPYDVLLGLLGLEQASARYPAPPVPIPGDPFNNPALPRECATFAQTGKRVCGPFLIYWREHGGLPQQGLPLTEVFLEQNPTDGKTYPTQYFERARFEYHYEFAGTENAVLLGLLGREQFLARYPYGLPVARDDFADPASGWPVMQQATGAAAYTDGGYRMSITQANASLVATSGALPAFGDVVVEVDVQKRGGPDTDTFGFGVACRVQDERNFYLLEINGGGLYGIVKVQEGRVVPLLVSGGASHPALRSGNAGNHLVARCLGDTLALVANGRTIAEARDAAFGPGKVGFVAGAYSQPGLEVQFDNLVIYRP